MKVKKGLKEFIKEKMEFIIYSDSRELDLKHGIDVTIWQSLKASALSLAYHNHPRPRVSVPYYPELKPGLVVELACKEKYLIVGSPNEITGIHDGYGYKMIGLKETLDTCMYRKDLTVFSSYAKLSAKVLDISKVYSVDNYGPGIEILLGEELPEFSMNLLWKR